MTTQDEQALNSSDINKMIEAIDENIKLLSEKESLLRQNADLTAKQRSLMIERKKVLQQALQDNNVTDKNTDKKSSDKKSEKKRFNFF